MSATVTAPPKPTGEADVTTAAQPISPPRAADPLEPEVDHDIAQRAYFYWEARGRPFGTPLQDWLRAERDIHKIQKERPGLTNLSRSIDSSLATFARKIEQSKRKSTPRSHDAQ